MKRSKRVALLLGVLVVVCAAAFAALGFEERQERIRNTDEIILELDTDSVTALAWDYEDTSLSFHKEEAWLYDGDEAFPVSAERMNELLEPFASLGAAFIIEEVDDYAQYGLDAPICTITIEAGEQTYEVQLGDYSQMDQQRYISLGDGNVYLVRHDPLEEFDAVLSDVIDHDQLPDLQQVQKVSFTGAQEYAIFYEEESVHTYCAQDVYFTDRDGGTVPLDTDRMDSLFTAIEGLDLTNYVTYNATEQELETYGLDTPELTMTLEYTYEYQDEEEVSDTFTLHVSQDPAQAAEDEGSEEAEAIIAYARVGDSQIVYQITETEYQTLTAVGYDDLRHTQLFTGDFADVTALDIGLEGQTYTLTVQTTEEDEDQEPVWLYNDQEVDITGLQSALEALNADTFTQDRPAGKEELSLTIHLDNEHFPEVAITLYRHDGASCLAQIDGQSVCYLPRASVVDLIEAVNTIVLGSGEAEE